MLHLTILVDADPNDSRTPVKARDLFNGIPLQSRAAPTPATISTKTAYLLQAQTQSSPLLAQPASSIANPSLPRFSRNPSH